MTNEWRDEQRRAQPFWQTHKNSFIAWVGAHVDCRSKLLYLFDGFENGFNVVFKKAYITNSQMNLAWNEKKIDLFGIHKYTQPVKYTILF